MMYVRQSVVLVVGMLLAAVDGLTVPSSSSSGGGYRADGGYYSRGSGGYSPSSSSYGGYSPSSGSADEVQKETKYYYGGKYQGNCVTDGLYYRDDTTFVICSNGYPHEQPCPPGTKTSGSPRYQPGYYYGYTDLCSVNLVDYGYGPEYYAPRGYPSTSYDGASSYDGRSGDGRSASAGGAVGGVGAGQYAGSYDRVGAREADYASGGLYGSVSKGRPYDGSSGYGKKDVGSSSSYAGRPSYGDVKGHYLDGPSKSPSSGYGSAPVADVYASKSRDPYSPPKSPYVSVGDKNY